MTWILSGLRRRGGGIGGLCDADAEGENEMAEAGEESVEEGLGWWRDLVRRVMRLGGVTPVLALPNPARVGDTSPTDAEPDVDVTGKLAEEGGEGERGVVGVTTCVNGN